MIQHHELYFIILAFLSEVLGTLSGVSSSALFVPLAKLLESAPVALALTASLHVLGNSVRTVIYWKSIDWKLSLRFGLPAIIMTGLGAQFSDSFSDQVYSVSLGIFLILFSIFFLFFKNKNIFQGKWLPFVGGALSGLLTGLLGSGGAVRSLALVVFNLNPMAFIATSTLIDFGGDILRLGIYLQKGYLNPEHYFYIPLLMLVAFTANWLAKSLLRFVPKEHFQKIVLFFVLLMGVISLVSAVYRFQI